MSSLLLVLVKAKPDYDKIRASKTEAMKKFKAAYDKAKAEGTITYRKI